MNTPDTECEHITLKNSSLCLKCNSVLDMTEQPEWEKTLKPELEKQLQTILKMAKAMQPKDDAEFIAVALPNLHIDMFHYINEIVSTQRSQVLKEVGEKEYSRGFEAGLLVAEEQHTGRTLTQDTLKDKTDGV